MPVKKNVNLTTRINGVITYDTRKSTSIPVRFDGRIEKLFIKYNFQSVRKGQMLLEIYSPELLTAQRDLIYLLKSDKENSTLINGAKERLRLLGISDSRISELISTGRESYSFPIYSPVDGYVVDETASDVVSGSGQFDPVKRELTIREGMYVSSGQAIFKVVDARQVWAEFDVYQSDASSLKLNDPLKLQFDNLHEVTATINVIQPFFKNGENFTKVRVYLLNAENKYSIGQLVTASFESSSNKGLWIPLSARLDLGSNEIAFIKRRGVFRPTSIITGHRSGDLIEIISGLESTDSVAYNAQFMVDSDSFVKVKN